MVPDILNAQGFFDFKQASEVAAEVAHATAQEQSIAFRHCSSRVKVPFGQLAQRIEKLYGVETVCMYEWIRQAIKLGMQDLIVSQVVTWRLLSLERGS